MPRVKRGTKRRARRKKILERASGYYLTKSKLYRSAKESVERGLKFAYSGRKQKKRQFRSIWIVRIGAAAKLNGTQLQPVHQRPEEGRHRTGSQDPGRSGGQRSRRVYGAVQAGAKRHGIARPSQGIRSYDGRPQGRPLCFEKRIHHRGTKPRRLNDRVSMLVALYQMRRQTDRTLACASLRPDAEPVSLADGTA